MNYTADRGSSTLKISLKDTKRKKGILPMKSNTIRKDIDVNEHEKLSNITLRHKFK